jgi:hypothetical protein
MNSIKSCIFLFVISLALLIRLHYREFTYLNGELISFEEYPLVFYVELFFTLGVFIYSVYCIYIRVKRKS